MTHMFVIMTNLKQVLLIFNLLNGFISIVIMGNGIVLFADKPSDCIIDLQTVVILVVLTQ